MPTVGDIARRYGTAYAREFSGRGMPRDHYRILRLLQMCGTGDLGFSVQECRSCGNTERRPLACSNRHCPGCGQAKGTEWEQAQVTRLLNVPYFMITFTLPASLRMFVRSHPHECYPALFQAAADALKKLARDPRFVGATTLGFTIVLHTWGRQGNFHPHLHVMIPAGGLNADGTRWLPSRSDFFVPVKALSRIYRAKFRDAMMKAGLLPLIRPSVWEENFVTDSQAVGDGRTSFRYLACYVSRTAISNSRIVSMDDGNVRFRWKKSGSRRWRTMTVTAIEFLRRFLQHVLPSGMQRIKHYGFLSSGTKHSIDHIRELVVVSNAELVDRPTEEQTLRTDDRNGISLPSDLKPTGPPCSNCGQPTSFLDRIPPERLLGLFDPG